MRGSRKTTIKGSVMSMARERRPISVVETTTGNWLINYPIMPEDNKKREECPHSRYGLW